MIRVRDAIESDIGAIAALNNWAIRETPAHFGIAEVNEAQMLADWRATRDRYPWLIAEESGEAGPEFLGYAKASPWKTREAYAWTVEVGVYVVPAAHGRGVGRALYTRLFDDLRSRGYRTILAGITVPNEASVRLHEAMGMRHVGTFPRVGFKFGAWRDVGYWAMNFGEGEPGETEGAWE
ncbi:MAG: N-acetyltransferase [Phycisphaeraceae bacterium]|nr:N-acetyltransferase [Phycisphaeraceae bacterium]